MASFQVWPVAGFLSSRVQRGIPLREHHVNRAAIGEVAGNLAGNMKPVFLKKRQGFLHQSMCWFEVGEAEVLAVKLESMPDNMHRTLGIPLFHQSLNQLGGKLISMELFHLPPESRLSIPNKSNDILRKKRPVIIPEQVGTGNPAALCHTLLDVCLKCFFGRGFHDSQG